LAGFSRVLVVQHPQVRTGFYDEALEWARVNFPAVHALFDVRELPVRPQWWAVRALIPWLQDPVEQWSAETFDATMELQAACDRRAIRVLNRVERLANAGKVEGAARMASTGLRVPRMVRILDAGEFRRDFGGLRFPIFIREDWGHGYPMLRLDTPEEARVAPLDGFGRPVATELVDVREADGLCYKYRYLACGNEGISHHLQASRAWITRGGNRELNASTRQRELDYISRPDRHHERFQQARRALGLDFVAFDYGLDSRGEPIVWEANPFPHIQFARSTTAYRNAAIERSVAAMFAMYLEAAALRVPAALAAKVSY